jgi:hypothetical protein
MNKRGDFMTVCLVMVYICGTSTVLAGLLLQPRFLTKKANERCIAYGGSVDSCEAKVAAMTTAEKKEYIRDTVEHPQPPNE